MTRRVPLVLGLGVLFGSTRKTFAHRSTAMYDMANPVTVKGSVKRFEWTNPHASIFEGPNVFAGPWLITRTFALLPEHNRVDEFFCGNNRDCKPLFGAK
jgi:Family of unknown function (DUF6152)